jgi:4-amino-4-deoxy-L-arabinose transferase-like glycosyltransferase
MGGAADALARPAVAVEALRSHPRVADRTALALAGVTFAALAFFNGATDIGLPDEAWSLQVVERVASGDSLYGEVWFGTTPLSVYLAAPLVLAFGADIAWVKLLVAASYGLSVVAALLLARRLAIPRGLPLLLALVVLVPTAQGAPALYQPLADLFLLCCFLGALAWVQTDGRQFPLALATGAAAGLAVGSKHTVGFLALAAAAGSMLLTRKPRRIRYEAAALAALACAAVALALLAPVAAEGSASAFYDDAFAGKSTYLEHAAVSPLEGVRRAFDWVEDGSFHASYRLLGLYWLALFPIAAGALAATAWIAARAKWRGDPAVVFLFTAAAVATAVPRIDAQHLLYAAPVVLVGAAYAVTRLARGARAGATILVAIALVPGALAVAVRPPALLVTGNERLSELPHFRGALVSEDEEAVATRTSGALARAADGEPAFLLLGEAGFYYLITGIENPTPFDIPQLTAFGSDGQDDVERAISNGAIDTACVDDTPEYALDPIRLMAFVEQHMVAGPDAGPCRIYRARDGPTRSR